MVSPSYSFYPIDKSQECHLESLDSSSHCNLALLPEELVQKICHYLDTKSLFKFGWGCKRLAHSVSSLLNREEIVVYRFSLYLKQVKEMSSSLSLDLQGRVVAQPSCKFGKLLYGPKGRVYMTQSIIMGMSGFLIFDPNGPIRCQFLQTSCRNQRDCILLGDDGFILYSEKDIDFFVFEEGRAKLKSQICLEDVEHLGDRPCIQAGRRKDKDTVIFALENRKSPSIEFSLKTQTFQNSSPHTDDTPYSEFPTLSYVPVSKFGMCNRSGVCETVGPPIRGFWEKMTANEKWTVYRNTMRFSRMVGRTVDIYKNATKELHAQCKLDDMQVDQVRNMQLMGDYLLVESYQKRNKLNKIITSELIGSGCGDCGERICIIYLPTSEIVFTGRPHTLTQRETLEGVFLIPRKDKISLGFISKEGEKTFAIHELQVSSPSPIKGASVISKESRWKKGAKVFLVSAVVVAAIGAGLFSGLYFGGLSPLAAYCVLGGSLGVGFVQLVVSGVCYKRHRALQQNVLITENSVFE